MMAPFHELPESHHPHRVRNIVIGLEVSAAALATAATIDIVANGLHTPGCFLIGATVAVSGTGVAVGYINNEPAQPSLPNDGRVIHLRRELKDFPSEDIE